MLNDSSGQREQLNEVNWGCIDDSADAQGYADYLARIETSLFFRKHQRHFFDAIPFEKGHAILDAGCGIGSHSRAIARELGVEGLVTGIDKSSTMIEAAKRIPIQSGSAGLQFETGDIGALRFPDEFFDGIICDRVFIHLENPAGVMNELRRVLKPNGWFGLTEPNWSKLVLEPSSPHTRLLSKAHGAAFRNGSIGREIKALLSDSGFAIHLEKELSYQSEDFHANWRLTNLERTITDLIDRSILTPEEANNLRTSLEKAEEEGRFRFSISWHICVGRKQGVAS